MIKSRIYYHRHLPHDQPLGGAFHVVFRLAGSLPMEAIEGMKIERETEERRLSEIVDKRHQRNEKSEYRRKHFEKFDALLDGSETGPHWLAQPAVADIVSKAIRYRDGGKYDLIAFSVMPNHVHMICVVGRPVWPSYSRKASSPYILTRILENLKWYTALKCNRLLGRTGAFWQNESYDHIIRNNQELIKTVEYVLNNPVKAGLVKLRELWPWNYLKPDIL
jgi:putative transposase